MLHDDVIHKCCMTCSTFYFLILALSLALSLSPSTSPPLPLPFSSTAPQNQRGRPVMDLAAIPSMPTNPNFTRNTPARSTYAYGTRSRPPPPFGQQYTITGGASAAQQAAIGGGFFKRLIPNRFSKRNR